MSDEHHHEHYVLPPHLCNKAIIGLAIGTIVTVAASGVNLDGVFGGANFMLAMAIATAKAFIVVAFFMGMWKDDAMNRGIFLGGFIFVAIFFVLTAADLFTRPKEAFIKPDAMLAALAASKGDTPVELRFPEPWKKTPELMAWGKEEYGKMCAACHMPNGVGMAALNSRDFTKADGWKKGRTPHDIVATLTDPKGLVGMANFSSEPLDKRWAMAYYVLSFGPEYKMSTMAQMKAAKVLPGAGPAKAKTIPVDAAIEMMATDGQLKK